MFIDEKYIIIKYSRLSITPLKILTSHCSGIWPADFKIYIEKQRHSWRIKNKIGALGW